jgi:hypothetical protein
MDDVQTMASLLGAVPGAEGAAVDVNMGWDDDVDGEVEAETLLKLAQEEPAGAGHDDGRKVVETIAKYPIPPLTKHENDLFERAKGRQTGRIKDGVPQIAVGRVYTGPAFIPKPAEIIFLDFEVGKRYKKRFTLTNASYTFNSFKLLDLPDEVVDFFTITYERPGRMSAGVSCFIDIEFVPKVNADIYTAIPFYSQTGPGAVPLKCLIRRCAPRVESTMIDFGKMTVGQKAVLPLRINNTQILPTGFTVMRVLPVDRRRAPGTGEEEEDDATLMSEEKDVAMDGLVAEGAESVRPFGVSEEKLPEGIPEGADDDGDGARVVGPFGAPHLQSARRRRALALLTLTGLAFGPGGTVLATYNGDAVYLLPPALVAGGAEGGRGGGGGARDLPPSDDDDDDESDDDGAAAAAGVSFHYRPPGDDAAVDPDGVRRFSGALNHRTIKGAVFLGDDGGPGTHVACGSDDGRFYVWDAATSELKAAPVADAHVVNVVAPHPRSPLTLATSGIDDTVKLFAPVGDRAVPPPRPAAAAPDSDDDDSLFGGGEDGDSDSDGGGGGAPTAVYDNTDDEARAAVPDALARLLGDVGEAEEEESSEEGEEGGDDGSSAVDDDDDGGRARSRRQRS